MVQTSEVPPAEENKGQLKDQIQELFRLDGRNKDHDRYTQERGNANLWH